MFLLIPYGAIKASKIQTPWWSERLQRESQRFGERTVRIFACVLYVTVGDLVLPSLQKHTSRRESPANRSNFMLLKLSGNRLNSGAQSCSGNCFRQTKAITRRRIKSTERGVSEQLLAVHPPKRKDAKQKQTNRLQMLTKPVSAVSVSDWEMDPCSFCRGEE